MMMKGQLGFYMFGETMMRETVKLELGKKHAFFVI
jgi:hypothetical protein